MSFPTDHQVRIMKEKRENSKCKIQEDLGRGGWVAWGRDRETFFSSYCLHSEVTENENGECRSKCNFLLQAAGRPGAGEVACPGELLTR